MLHLLPAEQGWRKNEQGGDQGGDKCMMCYLTSFFLQGRRCLKVSSGYEVDGSKMALVDKDALLWYLLAIKNKAPNHANLIESLLGINYMVNGTLKAIRDNWTWKAYISHVYWCGDAGIKKPWMCFRESNQQYNITGNGLMKWKIAGSWCDLVHFSKHAWHTLLS